MKRLTFNLDASSRRARLALAGIALCSLFSMRAMADDSGYKTECLSSPPAVQGCSPLTGKADKCPIKTQKKYSCSKTTLTYEDSITDKDFAYLEPAAQHNGQETWQVKGGGAYYQGAGCSSSPVDYSKCKKVMANSNGQKTPATETQMNFAENGTNGISFKGSAPSAPDGHTTQTVESSDGQTTVTRNGVSTTSMNGSAGEHAQVVTPDKGSPDQTSSVTLSDGTTARFNGTPDGADPKKNPLVNYKADRDRDRDDVKTKAADSNDTDCPMSAKIDGKYGCGGTRTTIETAQVSNALTQAAGSISTSVLGQAAQQQAMTQGTQSAALEAAASTQKTSGEIQLSTGGINVVMGAVQMVQSLSHKSDGKTIKGQSANAQLNQDNKSEMNANGTWNMTEHRKEDAAGYHGHVDGGTEVSGNIVREFQLNRDSTTLHEVTGNYHHSNPQAEAATVCGGAANKACVESKTFQFKQEETTYQGQVARRIADEKDRLRDIKSQVGVVGRTAANEQVKMAKEAQASGMMSLVTGAGQMVTGGFNVAAANQLEEAAKKMRQIEGMANQVAGFQPLGPGQVGPGDALANRDGGTITGTGGTPDSAASSSQAPDPSGLGNLGTPLGNVQANNPGPANPAGAFNRDSGGGGGPSNGSGGLGGLGGANTSPATGDNADPQAKMADARAQTYESGAGGVLGAGAGGGGGGGSKDPDLSSMLAQFLPGKKEEEKQNSNGILDFGSRGLASEGPISLLDRGANIFDRIHETYQDKNRRGRVGL